MGRKILGVLAGIITGFVLVFIVEGIGHYCYPTPPGLDMTNMEAMKEYVKTIPTGALLFVLTAWTIAAFGGGVVAVMIAKDKPVLLASIAGAVILLASAFNLIMIPHPAWFSVSAVILILAATFMAGMVGKCKLVKQPQG